MIDLVRFNIRQVLFLVKCCVKVIVVLHLYFGLSLMYFQCNAPCGRQGIKYRILQCVWYGTRRPAGNACKHQPRPAVMKVCRSPPCYAKSMYFDFKSFIKYFIYLAGAIKQKKQRRLRKNPRRRKKKLTACGTALFKLQKVFLTSIINQSV